MFVNIRLQNNIEKENEDNADESFENEENEENEEIQDEEDNARHLRDRNIIRRPDYYGAAIYCTILTPESYNMAISSEEKGKWQ